MFIYYNIEWENGTQIGLNAGDGSTSFSIDFPAAMFIDGCYKPDIFVFPIDSKLV